MIAAAAVTIRIFPAVFLIATGSARRWSESLRALILPRIASTHPRPTTRCARRNDCHATPVFAFACDGNDAHLGRWRLPKLQFVPRLRQPRGWLQHERLRPNRVGERLRRRQSLRRRQLRMCWWGMPNGRRFIWQLPLRQSRCELRER